MPHPRLIIRIVYDGTAYLWSSGDDPDDLQRVLNILQTNINENRAAVAVALPAQTSIPHAL